MTKRLYDLPAQRLASQGIENFGGNILCSPVLGFLGLRADVRGGDHIGMGDQGGETRRLGGEYIQSRGSHLTRLERRQQCSLIDDSTSGGVDDKPAALHLGAD